MNNISYVDVLDKAIEIVNSDNRSWSSHGKYCPYCAISAAKTIFDNENNLPIISTSEYVPSDKPLIMARMAITKTLSDKDDSIYTCTKDDALMILNLAKLIGVTEDEYQMDISEE